MQGWERHYKGMVEWLGPKVHDGVKSVDPKTMTVTTGFETYKNCALVNVIPAQRAGKIAVDAGLANATGYCPVDAENMASVPGCGAWQRFVTSFCRFVTKMAPFFVSTAKRLRATKTAARP